MTRRRPDRDGTGEAVLRAARAISDAEGLTPVRCDDIRLATVTASEAVRPEP